MKIEILNLVPADGWFAQMKNDDDSVYYMSVIFWAVFENYSIIGLIPANSGDCRLVTPNDHDKAQFVQYLAKKEVDELTNGQT